MSKISKNCLAGVAALVLPFIVQAADVDGAAMAGALETPAPAPAAAGAPVAAAAAAGSRMQMMGLVPLDRQALARKRGAADVFNDMQLRGVVADNRAINVSTGSNLITEGAFSGASGVPMVVQNSGNNVLIQSATILNIQVK